MNKKLMLIGMAMGMVVGLALWALDPPMLINYQGVLRNASNVPLTGSYDMVFRFYDASGGGNLLLTDTHNTGAPSGQVTVTNGLFSASLGAGSLGGGTETTLEGVFKNHASVYLEITVGADPAMTPRVQVVSAAYAQNCHSLDGNEASAFALATHNQDASTITTGTLAVARGGTGLAVPGTSGNVLTSDGSGGWISAPPSGGGDTVIGNEVTDASDATLTRSGAGTTGDPYKLKINLGNTNTWSGAQTFQANTTFPGSGLWDTSGNVAIGGTNPGSVKLYIMDTLSVANNQGIYSYVRNGTARNEGIFAEGDSSFTAAASNPDSYGGRFFAYGPNDSGTTGTSVGATGNARTYGTGAAQGLSGVARTDGSGLATGSYASGTSAGTGSAYGAFGTASATGSGYAYGVYGSATAATTGHALAGWFNGDVKIGGALQTGSGNPGTSGQVLQSTGTGIQWADAAGDADAVVGNEVTDVADVTLTRSGAGTSGDPYKLKLNLANPNTWAGAQTFGDARVNGVLRDGAGAPGTSGQVLQSTGTGIQWAAAAADADAVVGNEVTDASDTTLTRSGAGTSGDPYKLKINLGNANTWTGAQTFSTDTNFPGGIWTSDGIVAIGTTTIADIAALQIEQTKTTGSTKGLDVLVSNGPAGNMGVQASASSLGCGLGATTYGGWFQAGGPSVGGYGVTRGLHALASTHGSGSGEGVYANAGAVDGEAKGLWSSASATGSGYSYGVYSSASAATTGHAYAGYFDGMVRILTSSADAPGLGIGMVPSHQLELSADQAYKPSTNTWTISSDARLKKDIAPFTDGLSVIEKINPITYKYNGLAGTPSDKEGIGVIAQEIKDVAPYTVGIYTAKLDEKDESATELYSFNSHALTFVLINAVKELDERTKSLASSSSSPESSSRSSASSQNGGQAAGTAASSAPSAQQSEAGSVATAVALYPVCEPVEAGDVLVADAAHPGTFCLGRQRADGRVVGIVAAQADPALPQARQENSEAVAYVAMATSGIASCKVDASSSPIEVGDLLVTSAIPGHAARAVPAMVGGVPLYATGTIIGKALEPLESGAGVIKVLVMLR